MIFLLKVQSCKLYNNKYLIVSLQTRDDKRFNNRGYPLFFNGHLSEASD